MKNKKNRPSLDDIEKVNDSKFDSSYSPSKASYAPSKVNPKPKKKKDSGGWKHSNDTTENKTIAKEDLIAVERGMLYLTWLKFQKFIQRIVHNKYFRWFHLGIELIYYILVIFYLYFLMEIEEDNSIVLITIMMVFLFICLTIYLMNIIDHWNDIPMAVDAFLVILTISFDLYEISLRGQNKGYESGSKFALNFARLLRGVMLQRRASNFIAKLTNIYQSKKMKKQLKRRNSVTDMLNELLLYIGKDEKFLKKGINHVKDLVMDERRAQIDMAQAKDDVSDRFGYNHHERMDEAEELDRCVYELDPDKEDHQKAFKYAHGLEDDKVSRLLANIETHSFDIFELRSATNGNELVTVINFLMDRHDFYSKLRIVKDKFRKYSIVIQSMYNPIAYHNKTHASDVCQTCYYFMTTCKWKDRGAMTDLEQCVLLISGFVHDTDHPGYNNQYMVATRDKIALRYNDKSVLENHHISVAFSTMLKSSETRIFENFTNEEFKIMRENMIDLVLATDNIRHFSDLNYLKTRIVLPDFEPSGKDKKEITNYLIHLADISNPTKPWKLCYKWIDLLFVEFFHQGDKEREKGLPVSFLMDRYTTNIAGAQGGFIDNFIRPAFDLLVQLLPEANVNIVQMEENKKQWKALEEDYAPENKFTKKEEIAQEAHENLSSHEEESESDYDDIDISLDEENKILRYSTEQNSRKGHYTEHSSSPEKERPSSTS